MALLYADSFEHGDQDRYDSIAGTFATATGRRGGTSVRVGDVINGGTWVQKSISHGGGGTSIYGVAIKPVQVAATGGAGANNTRMVLFGSHWLWGSQEGWSISGLDRVGTLTPNVWHYIEFKVTNTERILRLNGEVLGTLSGTGENVSFMQLGGNNNEDADEVHFADLYVLDGNGSNLNDFLGDVQVHYLLPDGDTATIQLTGSDADQVNNYDNVNETTPSTADYNGSTSAGDKDYYTLGGLSTSNTWTVYGAQLSGWVGKTDGVSRYGRLLAQLGGSTEVTNAIGLSTAYGYITHQMDVAPTGSTWSVSKVNDLEVGFEVRAST